MTGEKAEDWAGGSSSAMHMLRGYHAAPSILPGEGNVSCVPRIIVDTSSAMSRIMFSLSLSLSLFRTSRAGSEVQGGLKDRLKHREVHHRSHSYSIYQSVGQLLNNILCTCNIFFSAANQDHRS